MWLALLSFLFILFGFCTSDYVVSLDLVGRRREELLSVCLWTFHSSNLNLIFSQAATLASIYTEHDSMITESNSSFLRVVYKSSDAVEVDHWTLKPDVSAPLTPHVILEIHLSKATLRLAAGLHSSASTRDTLVKMVYYFSSNTVSPSAFIYVGKDKVESA